MLGVKNLRDINLRKHYIPFDINKNSRLYYDDNVIYKLPFSIKDDFKDVLQYIEKCNLNELIELKGLIMADNQLKGYYFINYRNYKSLRKHGKDNLILKRENAKKVIAAFNKLNDYNICYKDFHLGNILYGNDEIKICDLDSICIKDDIKVKLNNLKQSLIVALAYMHNVSYHDISVLLKSNIVINNSELLKRYMELENLTDAYKIIDDIDLSIISAERVKIKKKSKSLSNTGYFDFDYI